jgi:predicted lipoprotein with Yx(FWY)xxD motif
VFTVEGSRMPRPIKPVSLIRRPRSFVMVLAVAGLALAAIAGMAIAKSFTLKVAKNVHVTNTPTKSFRVKAVDVRESVAVGATGFPVYTFQGETTHHIICKKTTNSTTNCWAFWPPVTVKSTKGLAAQTGIKGKLRTFKNHGLNQVTLGGKPLYYFTPDIMSHNKKMATGDELKTFGSIWHIVKASGPAKSTPAPPTNPMNPPLPPGY